MAIAKITGEGLVAIAILVALLWACALGERLLVQHANAETIEAVRAMRALQWKQRGRPASTPAQPARRPLRPALG